MEKNSPDKAENNRMRCSLVAVEAVEERLTTAEFCGSVAAAEKEEKEEKSKKA